MFERFSIVVGCFIAYIVLFLMNNYLFGSLGFSEAVSWIYLPSGFRLLFILIFAEWGAVGIALASMVLSGLFHFNGNLASILGTGLISGLSPLLARYVCRDRLGMDLELRNLTANKLIAVSVVFALMSASMHQVFYTWRGYTPNFIASTAVMAVGDLVGTVIMLYIAKFVVSKIRLEAQ
jgi:MASE1